MNIENSIGIEAFDNHKAQKIEEGIKSFSTEGFEVVEDSEELHVEVKESQLTYGQIKGNKYACSIDELIERAKKEPPMKMIWGGIGYNMVGTFFGPPKSGKSTTAECLGMCLAAGAKEFLGMPLPGKPMKVVMASLEEFWFARTTRNMKQIQKLDAEVGNSNWHSNYIVVDEKFPRYLVNKADWDQLALLIEESQANVLLIDSISRLNNGAIEESTVAQALMKNLRELVNRFQVTIIAIHHIPKEEGKQMTVQSMAGSRIIGQESDFGIAVGRTASGKRFVKEAFYRYADDNKEFVKVINIDANQWICQVGEATEISLLKAEDGRVDNTKSELILEYIQAEKDENNTISTSKLMKEFVDSRKMAKPTMYKSLDALIEEGKLKQEDRGYYKLI